MEREAVFRMLYLVNIQYSKDGEKPRNIQLQPYSSENVSKKYSHSSFEKKQF